MRRLSKDCDELSDRLLMLVNTFRHAIHTGEGLDHQQAKTFCSLLDESYEDALLLEAAVSVRTGRKSATVIAFQSGPVCVVDNTAPDGGRS